MNTPQTVALAAPQVRRLDDFAEFLTGTYQPLLESLADHGVRGTIVRGGSGHYLLVAAATPSESATSIVEVTDGGAPLPADPADVTSWVLGCPRGVVVRLPASVTTESLAATIASRVPSLAA